VPDGFPCARGGRALVLFLAAVAGLVLTGDKPLAQSTDAFPGGFLEKATSGEVRPLLSASQIQSFVPARGAFTFPAPWHTEAVRITNGGDCGGTDCVLPVGYSYWRNMNNHVGSDTILMFLGLSSGRGGTGPTLFSYNKVTEEVRNLGPLFGTSDPLRWASAEGWYFSATMPNALYLNSGSRLLRYDVITRQMTTVYDAATRFGSGYYIWQMHSSDDDKVHIATLRSSSSSAMMGCLAYREDTAQFSYYPAKGRLDECHLDRSGRWMIMLDNVDYTYGEDNRIVDLTTGAETLLLDQNGAAGHADVGYGYLVNEDDWNNMPGAVRVWNLNPLSGSLVYHVTDWNVDVGHITHTNARPGVPASQQYACSSNATRGSYPRANEILCWRLDGSMDVLVVAPVMTSLDASGGGDDYSKDPKGNLDVTGKYMIWTSNMGTGRLDAFVVKVPAHRLGGSSDGTAPTVTVTSPAAGASVSGTVSLAATAGDNVGVAGVQFRVDGTAVGPEDTSSPYTASWNTLTASPGTHSVTATARDAAGNVTVSAPVQVQVGNPPPAISAIAFSAVGATSAVVSWITDRPSDTQVEYGPTTAYGSMTTRQTALVTAHSQILTGLTPSTLYHVRVRSADASGQAVSGDQTFTTTQATAPPPAPPALIGHWKFDETGGLAAVDSSGNAYHGTIYNGALRVAGRTGGALALDGVNDYVDVPHRASMDALPLTLTAWIRTNQSGLAGVVNKYLPSSFNGYQLFFNGGQACAWYFRDQGNNIWNGTGCTLGASGLNDNAWHHLAVVMEESGGRLYVDGVLKATQAWKGIPGPTTTTVGLSIGRYPGVNTPYFSGAVDDVRLYGRALAATDIANIMKEADAAGDTVPPVISGLAVRSITSMSAVVDWVTNEPADTVVEFGPTSAYGTRLADAAMSPAHSRTLTGLAASTTYHYRVSSRDAAGNVTVSPDRTFTTAPQVASGTQDVQWVQVVNCTATGSSVQKTGGVPYMADAGAVSSQSIASGDGFLEFTLPEATTLRYVGLSSGTSGVLPGGIEFAIRVQAGIAEVRESGVYWGDVPAAAGDVFRVSISGGRVTYARNGVVFHTSARTPVYPLVGNAAFIDALSAVSQARIRLGS
jgi:hypothetical protein